MAKLGLQLYTIRDELEKDYLGTVAKAGLMGYEGVEFPGGLMEKVKAPELKKVLNQSGLQAAGAVFTLDDLENRLQEVIGYCKTIECPAIIIPFIAEEFRTKEGYRDIAHRLNTAGKKLRDYGMKLMYHVHGYEFDVFDGKTGIDILLDEGNPEHFNLETDVYWVEWGGADSVGFMKKYGNRSPYIHFKDMKDRTGKHIVEVGDGCLDMKTIAGIGYQNKADWFIVEQEEFDMPTLKSAEISCKNMKKIMGIEKTGKPDFTKVVIGEVNNNVPPAVMNTFSTAGDVNNDGWPDFVVSGRNGRMLWLENKGKEGLWDQHLIDEVDCQECGGSLVDLTGNGYADIINGGDWRNDEVCWWENPIRTDIKWKKRLITKTGAGQIHDTVIGDITGDGTRALIFTNQTAEGGTTIYYIPLPKDPYASPWPGVRKVASRLTEANPFREGGVQPEEGLAVGDVDNDGKNELVCGTSWYKYNGAGWVKHRFASGYITCKCAVADIDGDGRSEIILSEGDPCVYGKVQGGKLAWFKPGADITDMWQENVLEDFLFDAHSLQVGDICGNGRMDIFCAEVGKSNEKGQYVERLPRLMVFENDGKGFFTRHIIDEGTGTHEALLVDTMKRGVPDIAGKPITGAEIWNIHIWYNNRE